MLRASPRPTSFTGTPSQRSPAYVAQVTRVWRGAIDECLARGARYTVKPAWMSQLDQLAEGQQHTLGAYHRKWK